MNHLYSLGRFVLFVAVLEKKKTILIDSTSNDCN